jgi:hypothetical protein
MELSLLSELLGIAHNKVQAQVFEALSFGDMQKVIYEYVIKHTKGNKGVLEHARELARSTDDFWVEEFDQTYATLEKQAKSESPNLERIEDSLIESIMAVSDAIVKFYANEMNHHPGYEAAKNQAKLLDDEKISNEDLHEMFNKINPVLFKKAKDFEAEEAKRRAERKKRK